MSDQKWADRFGQDLDELLRGDEVSEQDAVPAEYRQSLQIARVLTTIDHSSESQRRFENRQRLVALAADSWGSEPIGRDGFWGHPLIAFPLAFVTLALICALMLPSSNRWSQISQPDLVAPIIETPVAAAQTAYAEWRVFDAGAQFPKLPPTANAAPTPTQAAMVQPAPLHVFVATGTPAPQVFGR